MNLTIISTPGQSNTLLFQVFHNNETRSCPDTTQRSYLFNREVTNGSFQAPISDSGKYCFVFDNEASTGAKTIMLTSSVSSNFDQVQVSNDGEMNLAGLVAGAFGLLVLIAGAMKKTIIPWE